MNRQTIYDYLVKNTDLVFSFTRIGKGKYVIFIVPYAWDSSFLLLNDMRITNFQSIILFSNEIAVRFWVNDDAQINIKYKDIEYFEVREHMDIRYMGLHNNEKVYH